MVQDTQRFFDAVRTAVVAFRQDLLGSLDGLTGPQFGVLSRLHRDPGPEPGPSLADLARDHCVTPPAMSKVVDGLVVLGLVARVPDPDDRRVNRHHLTPEGTAAFAAARATILARVEARLDALDPAHRAALLAAAPAFEAFAEAPQ